MRILALEPYYGGSHKAFIDGWIEHSRFSWTLLTLPPNKWKWRMRHGAITFAEQVFELTADNHKWDLLFCSDMLNLAEFLGLVGTKLSSIPVVVYFHENQLTYPVRFESDRDYQYVMTNLTTALAADNVWFNSSFHRDEFLSVLEQFLKRMPDNQPLDAIEKIRSKSEIYPPGINSFPLRGQRKPGPARILWAARWEHDKNPEDFFEAVKRLKEQGVDFRLNIIGEHFREKPDIFSLAKDFFAENIDQWGYQQSREGYEKALLESDIVVSTADHEFFGISIAEAVAAGAYPLVPKRLSYPDILKGIITNAEGEFFYDGSVDDLADKMLSLVTDLENGNLWKGDNTRGVTAMKDYALPIVAERMDNALENITCGVEK